MNVEKETTNSGECKENNKGNNKHSHRQHKHKHTHTGTHNKKGKRSQSHARLAPLRHRQLDSTGPIDVLHCALHSIRLVEAAKFYWKITFARQAPSPCKQHIHTYTNTKHLHMHTCTLYVPKAAATESVSGAAMTIERSYRCACVAIERKFALCTGTAYVHTFVCYIYTYLQMMWWTQIHSMHTYK